MKASRALSRVKDYPRILRRRLAADAKQQHYTNKAAQLGLSYEEYYRRFLRRSD